MRGFLGWCARTLFTNVYAVAAESLGIWNHDASEMRVIRQAPSTVPAGSRTRRVSCAKKHEIGISFFRSFIDHQESKQLSNQNSLKKRVEESGHRVISRDSPLAKREANNER
jgi:hypothetical protein|tara:strand:+ start:1867 stop:2202 length:336 start_codon:yes stop_codon:yes gene_type:complete